MKKIENKFITFIILGVLLITTIIFYTYRVSYDSFVVLLNGKGMLNNKVLQPEQREFLTQGDIVETIGADSLAVIEWGDGSVTRLGGDSRVVIDELLLERKLSKINIAFELLQGKTWSNVVSFMGEDSYFKETFRDNEAAVRGTVFNLDLDLAYLYVIDHQVLLKDKLGNIIPIDETQPFSLNTFSFLKLEQFIANIKDKSFEKLNKTFDAELKEKLKKRLESSLSTFSKISDIDISNLTDDKKKKLYNKIMQDYQKLNFVDAATKDLFKKKIEYKRLLIDLAGEKQKDALVKSVLLDLKNAIDLKEYSEISDIFDTLNKNIDIMKNIDITNYFDPKEIGEELKNILNKNLEALENIFGNNISNFISEKVNKLDAIGTIKDKAKQKLNQGLDTLFNKK